METPTIALLVALVAALVIIAILFAGRYRSRRLRETFGPEYERAVRRTDDRRHAESELEARQRRVQEFGIRDIRPDEATRYSTAWKAAQARFVDDPPGAVGEADRLVGEVMEARGYPVGDFEQRAADLSVDHATVVEHYRDAHAIASRPSADQADTEDLRRAMVHYRALFSDLLGVDALDGPRESPVPQASEPAEATGGRR
jgi:FtsZ-interacting cell division protein ZipA